MLFSKPFKSEGLIVCDNGRSFSSFSRARFLLHKLALCVGVDAYFCLLIKFLMGHFKRVFPHFISAGAGHEGQVLRRQIGCKETIKKKTKSFVDTLIK